MMKSVRSSLMLAIAVVLASCTSAPATSSIVNCPPDDLYNCYSKVLEQVLPVDLFRYSDIVFRRYDTYARRHNPTEFVASLDLNYRDGQRMIQGSYRRLLDENLYTQLSSGGSADAPEREIAAIINWTNGNTTAVECPGIADIWESARQLEPNEFSRIPQFEVSDSSEEEQIVIRLHARIYEVTFTIDDQTITVVQEGGPTAISNWVDEAISALESCNAKK